jgi:hypothetical protein
VTATVFLAQSYCGQVISDILVIECRGVPFRALATLELHQSCFLAWLLRCEVLLTVRASSTTDVACPLEIVGTTVNHKSGKSCFSLACGPLIF